RQVAYASVLGIGLHTAYLATRSLLVPMLIHFLNNAATAVLAWLVAQGRLTSDEPQNVPTGLVVALFAGAALHVAAVYWALYQTRARLTAQDGVSPPPWQPMFPGVQWPP